MSEPSSAPAGAAAGPGSSARPGGWRLYGLLTLLCLGLGLLEALQVHSGSTVRGRPLGFGRALGSVIPYWVVLAVLLPPVVRLAYRFPFDSRRWRRSLAVHLPAAAVFAVIHLGAAGWLAEFVLYREATLSFTANLGRLLTVYFTMEVLLYGAVIGAAHAFAFYGRYRERERAAARFELEAARLQAGLAEANLDTLRMQLQPHFLFNTLNAISVLALKGDRQAVVRMLNRLAELLRLTLENASQIVPLREELEFLERYLDIEQVRFADRLEVDVDVPAEALGAEVPSLLLQPLAENAVRHGVAKTAGRAWVRVRVRRHGDELLLEVEDSGPGFPPEIAGSLEEASLAGRAAGGVGLVNIRARLAQLYPGRHRVVLGGAQGGGALVTIAIPFTTPTAGSSTQPSELAATPV